MFKTFNSYVVYVLVIKRNEKLEKKKKKAKKRNTAFLYKIFIDTKCNLDRRHDSLVFVVTAIDVFAIFDVVIIQSHFVLFLL